MPSGSWIHISVKPQGSVAGSRMMGTPAAASRACPAWTSRTWIQIITECPGGRPCARRPRAIPGRGRTPPRDRREGRTPGRWPGPVRRGRSGGCGPSRWAAGGSGCSECPRDYFSITLSDMGGQGERVQAVLSGWGCLSAGRLVRADQVNMSRELAVVRPGAGRAQHGQRCRTGQVVAGGGFGAGHSGGRASRPAGSCVPGGGGWMSGVIRFWQAAIGRWLSGRVCGRRR